MDIQDKSKEELIKELKKLQQKYDSLKEILKEDSTEDKQTKKVLQESEDKFRTVANFTYDWEYWINTEGKIMYISPSCERITGYTPKEFLQNPELLTRIIHPDDKDIFKNHVHRVLGTNEMEPINFRIITKNNEERWIGHICQSVYDNNGNNLGQRGSNRDITERKQVEEALKKSDDDFRNLFDQSPAGSVVVDFERHFVKCNTAFCVFLGYTEDELIGKDIADFTYHKDINIGMLEMKQILKGKLKSAIVEKRYVHKDGSILWGEVNISLIRDANNNPVYFLPIIQNITKRKQAEEIITTQKKRLVYILKGTNVGTWEWNIQTGETVFDERWAEIIGYQLEEISPLSIYTWRNFCHPDDLIVSDELLEKHFNGELDYYEFEARMKHKNGDWKWVLDRGKVHKWDNEGKPLLMAGTHQDITKRKQMEDALKKSEEDFRNLFDQSPAGSVVVDFERHFVKCNTAFCDFLGYTEDELIGKDVTDFTYHKDINIGMLEIKQMLKGKLKSVIVEKRYVHKDGSILWGEVNMSLIRDANNNPVYFLPIIQNITKRKQAEEELIAAKKLTEESNKELENLNAQKNKFFSIIAHDLKSPFNSIVGFSNHLAEQVRKKDYNGIEKYAGIIEQSSNRAMDLLMNLMEWARSQTGRMEFNAEHFEMISLIKNVALLFDDIAGQKKISINTNKLPSQAPIFADKAMINTILRNLISNAIKFTHTGGEIIILTNENQKELTVSVSDNGVGIPKAYIKKIFRIDKNYTTSGTNKETGTGLGLILCKEFVEKHEGNIWAESEEGKGSTFYFTLPKEAETKENN